MIILLATVLGLIVLIFPRSKNAAIIQRFMKKTRHKRIAAFLNAVCNDSGVCIAFGKEIKKIKKELTDKLKIEDLKNMDFSMYANAYVKVIVANKQDPYLFEKLIDEIYKVGPVDVTIVEDFTEFSETEEDEDIVNQAEDTMSILSKFIDAQSLSISDPNKLKTLMRELYVEALSTENIE